jgi:hypothetical protein
MNLELVPRKTDKGRAEIKTRAFGVGHRERSLLIMVDGKTPASILVSKMAFLNKADEILDDLRVGGFIEAMPGATILPVRDATTDRAARPDDTVRTRHYARMFVLDALGRHGSELATRLAACETLAQLMPVLERCRDQIETAAGRRKAEEFWDRLGPVVAMQDGWNPF